jgi:hypothetical protein
MAEKKLNEYTPNLSLLQTIFYLKIGAGKPRPYKS